MGYQQNCWPRFQLPFHCQPNFNTSNYTDAFSIQTQDPFYVNSHFVNRNWNVEAFPSQNLTNNDSLLNYFHQKDEQKTIPVDYGSTTTNSDYVSGYYNNFFQYTQSNLVEGYGSQQGYLNHTTSFGTRNDASRMQAIYQTNNDIGIKEVS